MYNLEWDEFQNNAGNTLKNLLSDTAYTDVTLVCDDDNQMKAHKVVLSSCSPFFKNLLMKNPHPSPLIYLKGISFAELNSIIKFIYLGQTEVKQDDLNHFLEVAKDLKVQGLIGETRNLTPVNDVSSNAQNYAATLDTPRDEVKEVVEDIKTELEQIRDFNQYNFPTEVTDTSVTDVTSESFNCDHCSFGTRSSSSLQRHQKLIHTVSREKLQCNLCEKVFSLPHGLAQHNKKSHDIKKYSCNKCGFETIGEYRLKVHLKRMHTNDL